MVVEFLESHDYDPLLCLLCISALPRGAVVSVRGESVIKPHIKLFSNGCSIFIKSCIVLSLCFVYGLLLFYFQASWCNG